MGTSSFFQALLWCILFVFSGKSAYGSSMAVPEMKAAAENIQPQFTPDRLSEAPDWSRKSDEKKLSRRLKFKERLAFRLVKRHVKRMHRLGMNNDDCARLQRRAKDSVTYGIFGLFLFGILLGTLAIIAGLTAVNLAKRNPDCLNVKKLRKKGRISIILGIIDIVVFIGLLILLYYNFGGFSG